MLIIIILTKVFSDLKLLLLQRSIHLTLHQFLFCFLELTHASTKLILLCQLAEGYLCQKKDFQPDYEAVLLPQIKMCISSVTSELLEERCLQKCFFFNVFLNLLNVSCFASPKRASVEKSAPQWIHIHTCTYTTISFNFLIKHK